MKNLFKIILSQLKNSAFEFLIDVILQSVAEHRRARKSGQFDVYRSNYNQNDQNVENRPQQDQNESQNFFNKLKNSL